MILPMNHLSHMSKAFKLDWSGIKEYKIPQIIRWLSKDFSKLSFPVKNMVYAFLKEHNLLISYGVFVILFNFFE